MPYDPQIHHRRSIRLKGYDYTRAGAYFVTFCINKYGEILGDIANGEMQINQSGRIVQSAWFDLPRHYPYIQLDTFCIMPNHVHAIIIVNETTDEVDSVRAVGAGLTGMPINKELTISSDVPFPDESKTRPYNDGTATRPNNSHTPKYHPLSEIVRAWKSFSARRINGIRNTHGVPVWQRNYYEHIIRDENDFNLIRTYISNNPKTWQEDQLHPSAPLNRINQD